MKPYAKAQKVVYIGLQDRRRKLTDEQRAEVLRIRQETGAGYRTIARAFGVSRSLVRFICDPDAAERCRARSAANWRKYRELRGRAENAASMRKYRSRKYRLYMAGELVEKPTPTAPREKVKRASVVVILPDGTKKGARLPLSFVTAEGDGVHHGRKYITKRQGGFFFRIGIIKKGSENE